MQLFNGFKFPKFTAKTLFSLKAHNARNQALNALLSQKIVSTTNREKVTISDENVVTEYIPGSKQGTGDGMHYKFEYDSEVDYSKFDVVRVSPSNLASTDSLGEDDGSRPGVYIAIVDVPAESPNPRSPIQTDGENGYWHWLSTWPEDCPLG